MRSSITFYQRFVNDILVGKKTITIRNEQDKDFCVDSIIKAFTYEDNIEFAQLRILSITPIRINELNESHAFQENMTLNELTNVIQEIYPKTDQLFIISFQLQKREL